jgi:hypothetical protein
MCVCVGVRVEPSATVAQPPYLAVPGFQACLDEENSTDSSYISKCLPSTPPTACNSTAWKLLQGPPALINLCKDGHTAVTINSLSPRHVALATSQYLNLPNFADCISKEASSDNNYNVRCLPSTQPVTCNDSVWQRLQGPPRLLNVCKGRVYKGLSSLFGIVCREE